MDRDARREQRAKQEAEDARLARAERVSDLADRLLVAAVSGGADAQDPVSLARAAHDLAEAQVAEHERRSDAESKTIADLRADTLLLYEEARENRRALATANASIDELRSRWERDEQREVTLLAERNSLAVPLGGGDPFASAKTLLTRAEAADAIRATTIAWLGDRENRDKWSAMQKALGLTGE